MDKFQLKFRIVGEIYGSHMYILVKEVAYGLEFSGRDLFNSLDEYLNYNNEEAQRRGYKQVKIKMKIDRSKNIEDQKEEVRSALRKIKEKTNQLANQWWGAEAAIRRIIKEEGEFNVEVDRVLRSIKEVI